MVSILNRAKQKWIGIAERRILNILRRYLIASMRQLEAKISEAGPKNQRAEPLFITEGIKSLKEKGKIKSLTHELTRDMPFYTLSKFNSDNHKHKERFDKIACLYKKYLKITLGQGEYNKADCGEILEEVTYKSVLDCNLNVIGSFGDPPKNVNGYNIEEIGVPEFVLLYPIKKGKNIRVFIECKNKRRWLYADAHEIWNMLYKSAKMEMVPILAARKIGYNTRFLFKKIGALCFETHFQYFAPYLEEEMKDIIHKEGLGFHATRFSRKKEERFIKFFNVTVPRQVEDLHDRFLTYKDVIIEIGERLKDKNLPIGRRNEIYHEEVYKGIIRPDLQE